MSELPMHLYHPTTRIRKFEHSLMFNFIISGTESCIIDQRPEKFLKWIPKKFLKKPRNPRNPKNPKKSKKIQNSKQKQKSKRRPEGPKGCSKGQRSPKGPKEAGGALD